MSHIDDQKSIERIKNANENNVIKHKFKDFATEDDKQIAKEVMEWDISDKELFE